MSTFHPNARQLGKGFVVLCVCIRDRGARHTSLGRQERGFANPQSGWIKSNGLSLDVDALERTLRALVRDDAANASYSAAHTDCG